MGKTLLIGCMHGKGGTGRGNPQKPWLNDDTYQHYLDYTHHLELDGRRVRQPSLEKVTCGKVASMRALR